MKKVFVLLAAGFMFAFCNPTQQTDATTTDTSRVSESTTTTPSTGTDTTARNMPDTTTRRDSTLH
jgi:uncharacterized lipoprotein YajG